jgi:hypothetical protein
MVRTLYAFSVLDFCAHHYSLSAEGLTAAGFIVEHDLRKKETV